MFLNCFSMVSSVMYVQQTKLNEQFDLRSCFSDPLPDVLYAR